MAIKRLGLEYKKYMKDPYSLYILSMDDNLLEWNFTIFGPEDTLYEGGIFTGIISFTINYPNKAPKVKFNNIIHPNIYKSGEVCISILHDGEDNYGYEKINERWSPAQNVNSIMLSIISMLSDPNFDSPANIDATVLWKDSPEKYKLKIYKLVADSQK
jgi:ubiquitin-conjugating enzyme E2 G1